MCVCVCVWSVTSHGAEATENTRFDLVPRGLELVHHSNVSSQALTHSYKLEDVDKVMPGWLGQRNGWHSCLLLHHACCDLTDLICVQQISSVRQRELIRHLWSVVKQRYHTMFIFTFIFIHEFYSGFIFRQEFLHVNIDGAYWCTFFVWTQVCSETR